MLGIPSRSDARKAFPDYAEAVEREELERKLNWFDQLFSTIFPHNHLAEAYRDTGNIDQFLKTRQDVWSIDPALVPEAVHPLLKPELVRDHYVAAVENFREVLAEARPWLDQETSYIAQTFGGQGNIGGRDSIDVKVELWRRVKSKRPRRWHRDKGVRKYSFNPYKLAVAVLNEFESTINQICEVEPTAIRKIMAMAEFANGADKATTVRLVKSSVGLVRSRSTFVFESKKESPVGSLVDEHHRIAAVSDLWLRFDELYFVARLTQGDTASEMAIPADCLLDQGELMTSRSLQNRVTLRHFVDQVIEQHGQIVINGQVYQPEVVQPNQQGYVGQAKVDQTVANLLGRPVRQPDAEVIYPAPWVEQEIELVEAFVQTGDVAAAEELLLRYESNASYGNPTREKFVAALYHSCRPVLY